MKKLTRLLKRRSVVNVLRVLAFAGGSGIAFLGAGNIMGINAVTSAAFGASGAVLGLVGALLFLFAGKGDVPQSDFDSAINQAIEQVRSQTSKDDK